MRQEIRSAVACGFLKKAEKSLKELSPVTEPFALDLCVWRLRKRRCGGVPAKEINASLLSLVKQESEKKKPSKMTLYQLSCIGLQILLNEELTLEEAERDESLVMFRETLQKLPKTSTMALLESENLHQLLDPASSAKAMRSRSEE